MKKIFSLAFALLFAVLFTISASAVKVDDASYYAKFKGQNITLNVYNWGEYISNGEDKSVDVIKEFENLTGIHVNYTNYASNEDLYAKLSSSSAQYDIVIPSDYMIARMIKENMLQELNFNNIPNIKYISEKYRKTDFDTTGAYTVPYMWGTVGIIYNKKYVKEPVDSWNILWNEKYKGKILMFSNSRDAFGVALKKLGYSLNTTNADEINAAADALKKQKGLVQAYVMDQVFDKMELEEAYLAPYYAGDAITMIEKNKNLAFAYPKEGTNIFIDSICIPKGSKNKEAAEAFINFLCETDIAVANCECIAYSTPHSEALKKLDQKITGNKIAYPDDTVLANAESFIALPAATNSLMDSLWIEIKSGLGDDSTMNSYILPVAIILALAVILLIVVSVFRKYKKKNNNY